MRGGVLQFRQQCVISGLLLLREYNGLILQRDGGIQVDGFVHLGAFQHAFGTEIVQHGAADALFFQLRQGAGAAAQQGHGCQLFGGGPWLLRQGTGQPVGIFCMTDQLLLQHGRNPIGRHGGLVLCPVGDDRLDRLVIGAEGALLQKVHQPQQLRGQTGRRRGHVEQELELGMFRLGVTGQHHPHAGAAAPAKGHQHHAAQTHLVLMLRQNGIGVQFIKMEGRVAYGNTHRFWHGHGLLCGLIYCAIPARRQMT